MTRESAPAANAVLTIDLAAIVGNWRLLAAMAAPASCAAVVKADAYGLGIAPVARALSEAGCRTFFVATLDEGLRLRGILPDVDIAVFYGLGAGEEEIFRNSRLWPVLNHLGELTCWQDAARRRGEKLPAMLHIDTGMNRLGLEPNELTRLAAEPERLDGIDLRLILSHFACADQAGHPMTAQQEANFRAALNCLPKAPASLANSSGIFRGKHLHFDMVRPGTAFYGVNPTPETINPMQPVITLSARILQVRHVDSPMTVGYGALHAVAGPRKIATLAMGYADGYHRVLSGIGTVAAGEHLAPVVGRVSMDLITVDVTGWPENLARPGGMVQLIGPHRPVDQVAGEAGTVGYEILTSLGNRLQRVYCPDGLSM